MKPLFWIIDEEWPDYQYETDFLEKKYPGCTIRHSGYDYQKDLTEWGYLADAILAQVYTSIPQSTIDRLENCKGIAIYGGGFDRVDILAAGKKKIMVTNVKGYCAEDLADYIMAAIYHENKQLDRYYGNIHNGLWGAQVVPYPPHRISESALLIIGFGRIGKTVAEKAKKQGMQVLAFDSNVTQAAMRERGVQKVDWETGLKSADYISVNVNLCETTRGLISKKDFALMKPNACLINTSRGAVIVEDDLIEAIKGEQIAGAVLDVITHEPPEKDEKIFNCKNIVVTPHISYISQESYQTLKERTVNNAVEMLSGVRPGDLVNAEYLV